MPLQLIKLLFKFNRLSERDRLSSIGIVIFLLFGIWYFLIFSSQEITLAKINTSITQQQLTLNKSIEKRAIVESLIKDNSITQLAAKHEQLQKEMKGLDKEIERFQGRYIDDRELAKLLYSILQQTSGVSILGFSNVTNTNEELTSDLPPPIQTTLSASTATGNAVPANTQNADASASLQNDMEKHYYRLTLKGNYFSILEYLQILESARWTIYWNEMNYTVTAYPEATVVLIFYTLKPNIFAATSSEEKK